MNDLNFKQQKALFAEEKKEQRGFQYNFSKEEQQKIVELIIWKAEQWEKARQPWMEKVAEARRLYEGSTSHIIPPWDDAPLFSTKVTTWVVDLLLAKLFPLVWNESLIYWKGREKTDVENVEKVRKFMRWVIVEDLRLADTIKQLLEDLLIDGTFAVKIHWQVFYKWVQRKFTEGLKEKIVEGVKRIFRNYRTKYEYKRFEKAVVERIPIDDVLFPWYATNLEDYECIHRVYYTYNQLEELQERGYIINVDETLITGIDEKRKNLKGGEKVKVEEEGFLPHDMKEREAPIECLEGYITYKVNGRLVKSVFLIAKTARRYLSGKPLVKVSRIEEKPIFVWPFISRSGRLLGTSIAQVVAPLHKEMDAIHNQRIHAGTIAIAPPGFYRPASGFKPKEVRYGPGMLVPLDNPRQDIVFPTFSAGLFQISFQEERMVLELIERLTSVSSYMLGKESEIVKSRATATGTLALIGQAEQKFTSLAKKVQDGIAQILVRILRQYQEKMPPGLSERILGEGGEPLFPENITPEDLIGEFDCYLELDFASSNRTLERQTAIMMYQQLQNEPLINRDPALRWELTADYLRAMGKKEVEKYIGNKPPSMEAYSADAEAEFTQMMEGKRVEVKPNENAMAHLIAHLAQRNSDRYMLMPEEYRGLLDEHIIKTRLLAIYQVQRMAQQAQLAQQQTPMQAEPQPAGGGVETYGTKEREPVSVTTEPIGSPRVAEVRGTQKGIGAGLTGEGRILG